MAPTSSGPHVGTVVLLLGVATMLSTLAAGAFFMTDQGAGLVGYREASAAALSVLLFASTAVSFAIATRRGPLERRAVLGSTLAVGAGPTVRTLAFATDAVLGAFHVYW